MKSSVHWVFVFSLAEEAHFKIAHGGVWTVVWKAFHDSISWSAVCAGYEEILIPLVRGRFEFFLAFFAYGDVGRDYGA